MTLDGIGLLLGLFVAPGILLPLGHRLRHRSAQAKRMFWGGVVGHTVGACVTMIALMLPPVMWQSGTLRIIAAHWAMAIGFAIGAVFGAARSRLAR